MDQAITGSGLVVTHHGRSLRQAPTLVLLHGLTDSGECWPDAVRRWQDDYHVVTFDARGHGDSPRWTDEQLARGVAETMRDDAVALVEHVAEQAISRPVLVGHSMGGSTAWALALARPDLVGGLVLEDPAVPGETTRDPEAFARRQQQALREAADPELHPRNQRTGPWSWPTVEREPWSTAKQQVDERMLATGIVCLDGPWPQLWAELRTPTLVVTGTEQTIIDAHHRRRIAELANPWISVVVIPDADHCVRRSDPDAFHAVVDPFVARVAERTVD